MAPGGADGLAWGAWRVWWVAEPVGFPYLLASAFEIGIIGLMLPTLVRDRFQKPLTIVVSALGLIQAVNWWAFVLVTIILVVLSAMAGASAIVCAAKFIEGIGAARPADTDEHFDPPGATFNVGRIRGGVDIRTMGSGNAGGTNALRTQGWVFALGVVVTAVRRLA